MVLYVGRPWMEGMVGWGKMWMRASTVVAAIMVVVAGALLVLAFHIVVALLEPCWY
jgi:hypothetical protein